MVADNKINPPLKSILLIEDNEDDILLTKLALSEITTPPHLLAIKNGKEGLDYLLGENNTQPALTLIDLKLPIIDGISVIEMIAANERLRSMPLVVLTTSLEPSDIKRCYNANINSYLRKPVDYDEFKELISKTVEYWLTLNIPASHH
ncbi:MAG: response regulator [Thiotrichaceae bacterium]|nr:response regulator [Thiotrichaceae bacterium]